MEYSIPTEILNGMEHVGKGLNQEYTDKIIKAVSRTVLKVDDNKNLPDPIDFIKEVMKQRGLCNKDLKVYIGSSGNVSSVLNRHKPLSLRMIRNLHKYLGIPARILIQPYDCR